IHAIYTLSLHDALPILIQWPRVKHLIQGLRLNVIRISLIQRSINHRSDHHNKFFLSTAAYLHQPHTQTAFQPLFDRLLTAARQVIIKLGLSCSIPQCEIKKCGRRYLSNDAQERKIRDLCMTLHLCEKELKICQSRQKTKLIVVLLTSFLTPSGEFLNFLTWCTIHKKVSFIRNGNLVPHTKYAVRRNMLFGYYQHWQIPAHPLYRLHPSDSYHRHESTNVDQQNHKRHRHWSTNTDLVTRHHGYPPINTCHR